jgi:hypothetical protein
MISRISSATTSIVSNDSMARRTSSGGGCNGLGLDTRPWDLSRDMG